MTRCCAGTSRWCCSSRATSPRPRSRPRSTPLTADGRLLVSVREVPVEAGARRHVRARATCSACTAPTGPGSCRRSPRCVAALGRQHHRPHDPADRRPLRAGGRGGPAARRGRRWPDRPAAGSGRRAGGGGVPAPARHRPAVSGPRPGPSGGPGAAGRARAGARPRARPRSRSTRGHRRSCTLAADLLATQRSSPGCVGLAAPQVGVRRAGVLPRRHGPPEGADLPRHARAGQPGGRVGVPAGAGPRGLPVGARPHRRREAGDPAGRGRAACPGPASR